MQLRNLDIRDSSDKYIVLDLSSADALASVLKQVSCYLFINLDSTLADANKTGAMN